MNQTKIILLSAFLCVGTLLETSCNNDNDDFVIWSNNTEQSNPTNSQNQQNETDTETVSVSGVTLDKSSISIEVDETLQLTATVSPDNATDKTVTWSSSEDAVATVENGKVTAIKEGEATITAKVGDKTAECKVTVSAPAAKTITVSVDSDDATIKPSFTEDNVTAKLKMSISEGETELGTLTLQDTDGNFSGELTTAPSADGVTLTATILTTGDATSSTVSIADLIKNCAHKYTGTFKYKTDTKVMLTDDKAYIEIIMSPLQHNIDVTIGGEKKNYAMSNDGKVWIAVDGGTKFTMNFTNEKTTAAGKITTIKREGLVDLGLSDGTLWADANVTGENSDNEGTYKDGYGWYYTFDQAQKLGVTLPTGGTDENTDFKNLYNECYWVWDGTNKGYNVFKSKDKEKDKQKIKGTGSETSYSADTDPHIFLPAAGWCDGGDGLLTAGSYGYYWSSTESDADNGYRLYFYSSKVRLNTRCGRDSEFPVRLVRHK